MRVELVPGMTNVVQFPVEFRVKPSLDLLREIAPDSREVDQVVDAWGFEHAFNVRWEADKGMAEHILNHVRPEPGAERAFELDRLLSAVLVDAVEACKAADRAADAAVAAARRLLRVQAQGGRWTLLLEEDATGTANEAARRLVDAYEASETAEGYARAIGIARRGEVWAPRDVDAELRAMCAAYLELKAARARRAEHSSN